MGERRAEMLTNTVDEAAQVERANASNATTRGLRSPTVAYPSSLFNPVAPVRAQLLNKGNLKETWVADLYRRVNRDCVSSVNGMSHTSGR
jgi:hypothetical protein